MKVEKIFQLCFSVSISFLFSSCTNINGEYKKLWGAWTCSSEPGIVRVFYKNGQYMEFGRATPYARKLIWRYDYIRTGFYSLRESILTIRAKPIMLLNGKVKTGASSNRSISRFVTIELQKKSLFLKQRQAIKLNKAIATPEALLCKKKPVDNFRKFVSYLARTQLANQANKSRQLKRIHLLRRIIRKKWLLSNQLNRVLSRQHNVGLLWLLKELELDKHQQKSNFYVRRVMRNGDYFEIEMVQPGLAVHENILSRLKASNLIKIVRTKIYKTYKGLVVKVTLKRSPGSRIYLSLVSLPDSTAWLSHHKLQLKQLQLYQKLFSRRTDNFQENYLNSDADRGVESISMRFPGVKWSIRKSGQTGSKKRYRLSYVASYNEVKKLLHYLSNNNLRKEISTASIKSLFKKSRGADYRSSQDASIKKVKFVAKIQLYSKKPFNNLSFNRLTEKTHLLSIVPIKAQAILSFKKKLFN